MFNYGYVNKIKMYRHCRDTGKFLNNKLIFISIFRLAHTKWAKDRYLHSKCVEGTPSGPSGVRVNFEIERS
jgi:hypothetical protein